MKKLIFMAALFICLPAILFAEEANSYTLKQLTEIALKKNDLIRAKKAEVQAYQGSIRQATTWQNPSIGLQVGRKNAPDGNGLTYGVTVNQPFVFLGKNQAKEEIHRKRKEISGISVEDTKLNIYLDIIYLAFAYNEAIEHAAHLDERRERFALISRYLRSRRFASPQKIVEKHLVQNKVLGLQREILQVITKKNLLWTKLNTYLQFKEPVDIKAHWFVNGINLTPANSKELVSQNLQLKKLKMKVQEKQLQQKLASLGKYPDFSLMGYYSQESSAQTEKFAGAGLTVQLPLFDRRQGTREKHRAEKQSLESEYSFLKKEQQGLYQAALFEYYNNRRLLQNYPVRLLNDLHNQMEYTDREFRKGRVNLTTFLEAEQTFSELHNMVFETQLHYLQSYLAVLQLEGRMQFKEEVPRD